MSGILIDVDTKSGNAHLDLAALSRKLSAIQKNSAESKDSLNRLASQDFGGLSSKVTSVDKGISDLGKTSQQTFEAVKSAANEASKAASFLKTTILNLSAAFAAMKSVTGFQKVGDDLLQVQSKLRLVIDGTYELADAQRQLTTLSKETYSSLKSSANIYYNLQKSVPNLSGNAVSSLTRTIQQAAAIQGGSKESIEAAMTQLNQGLAAGVLRGEEYNSVLEQMSPIVDALGKSLNMTRGELRKLANDGGITTDLLVGALQDQADNIEELFSRSTVTAQKGLDTLRASIALTFGEINNSLGLSSGAGRMFLSMEKAVDNFREKYVTKISISFATIKNSFYELKKYLNDVDTFGEGFKTLRDMLGGKVKWDIGEIFTAYKTNSEVSYLIDLVRELKGESTGVGKILENVSAVAKQAFSDMVPDFSFDLREPEYIMKSFKDSLHDAAGFVRELLWAVTGLFSKVDTLIPDIRKPVITLKTQVESFVGGFMADIAYRLFNVFLPFKAVLIDSLSIIRLMFGADDRLERAMARVLEVKGMKATTEALRSLGYEARNFRFNNLFVFAKDGEQFFQSFGQSIKDFGIYLGLVEQRGMFIGMLRFDRLIDGLKVVQNVAAKTWENVFRPRVMALAASLYFSILSALRVVSVLLEKTLTFDVGLELGYSLGIAISNGLLRTVDVIRAIIGRIFSVDSLASTSEATNSVVNMIILNFKRMANFVTGFMQGLGLAIIDFATYTLNKAADKVDAFGTRVKDIFFDIYDKVVGHSYWPDLVEEVNMWTDKLFVSETRVDKFGASIKRLFQNMYEFVRKNSTDVALKLHIDVDKLKNIDFTTIQEKLSKTIWAGVLAGFLLAFGGPVLRIIGFDYIFTSVSHGLMKAFAAVTPYVANKLAEAAGTIGQELIGSIDQAFNMILDLLPTFFKSLFDGMGPIGDLISKIFDNHLISALVAGLLVFAVKIDGAFGKIWGIIRGIKQMESEKKVKTGTGMVDYVKAFFPNFVKEMGKVGLLQKMVVGSNMGMLYAGIAAISTAYFDAISLMEAAAVGVPLIVAAIMGPEGNARLALDILGSSVKMIGKGLKKGLNAMLGKDSTIGTALVAAVAPAAGPLSRAFTRVFGDSWGPVKASLGVFKGRVADALGNFLDNRKLYAEGKISLTNIFDKVTQGEGFITFTPSAASKAFKDMINSIFNAQIMGTPLKEVGGKLTAGIANGFRTGGEIGKSAFTFIIDAAKSVAVVMAPLTSIVTAFFSSFITGVKALGTVVASMSQFKIVIGIILAMLATFASAAQNTTESVMSLSEVIKFLVVDVLVMGAVFGQMWKLGERTFEAYKAAGAQGLTGTARVASAMGTVGKEYKESIKDFGGSIRDSWKKIGDTIGPLVSKIKDFVSSKLFKAVFWLEVLNAAKSLYDSLSKLTILELITTLFHKFQRVATGTALAGFLMNLQKLVMVFKEAVKVIGVLGAIRAMFVGAASAIAAFAGASLGWIAAIAAAIAALVVGLGYVVGEGDDLEEKFSSLLDKARELVGMQAKSSVGRQSQIEKKLNTSDARTLGLDPTGGLDQIDFSQVTAEQYNTLVEASDTTAETMKRMAEYYRLQGRLTNDQDAEVKQAIANLDRYKASLAKKSDTTSGDVVAQLYEMDTKYNDSILTGIGRLMDFIVDVFVHDVMDVGYAIADTTGDIFGGISAVIFGGLDNLLSSLNMWNGRWSELWDYADSLAEGVFGTLISVVMKFGLAIWGVVGSIVTAIGTMVVVPFKAIWFGLTMVMETLTKLGQFLTKDVPQWFRGTSLYKIMFPGADRESVKAAQSQRDKLNFIRENAKYSGAGDFGDTQTYVQREIDAEKAVKSAQRNLESTPARDIDAHIAAKLRLKKANDELAKASQLLAEKIDYEIKTIDTRKGIDDFEKQLDDASKSYKEFLGLDMGDKGANFFGTKEDLAKLDDYKIQVQRITQQLKDTDDQTLRNNMRQQIEAIKAQAKFIFEQTMSAEMWQKQLEIDVKVSGTDMSTMEIAQFFAGNQSAWKAYDDQVKATAIAEQDFWSTNRDDADAFNKALQKLNAEKDKLNKITPKKGGAFGDIISGLQEAGISNISGKLLSGFKPETLNSMVKASIDIANAKRDFELASTGGNVEAQIQAWKNLDEVIRRSAKSIREDYMTGLREALAAGNARTADEMRAALGVATPDKVAGNLGAKKRFDSLSDKILAKEDARNASQSDSERAKLQKEINNLKEQQGKLSEDPASITARIQKAAEYISNLTTATFVNLDNTTQGVISSLASKILSTEKLIGDKLITGKALKDAVENIQKWGRQIETLKSKVGFTGKGIAETFGKLGLAPEQVKGQEDLVKQMIVAQNELDEATKSRDANEQMSHEEWLKRNAEVVKKTKELADLKDKLKDTRETALAGFNSTTQANFSNEDSMLLGGNFIQAIAKTGKEIAKALTEATNDADWNTAVNNSMAMVRLGKGLTFLRDLYSGMRDVMTEGAKAAFDRISSMVPNLIGDFNDFTKLQGSDRRRLSKDAFNLQSLQKAFEVPDMSPAMAAALEKLNPDMSNAEAVLSEFSDAFKSSVGTAFSDTLKTPMEQMLAKLDQINSSILLTKGISANTEGGKPAVKGSVDMSPEAYNNLREAQKYAAKGTNSTVASAMSIRRRIAKSVKDLSVSGLDERIQNLLPNSSLKSLEKKLEELDKTNKAIEKAREEGTETAKLEGQAEQLRDSIQSVADEIAYGANLIKNSADTLRSTVSDSLAGAFNSILKKTAGDDGKGWFGAVADSFTNSILDTFSKELSHSLTKKGGIIGGMIDYTANKVGGFGESIGNAINSVAGTGGSQTEGDQGPIQQLLAPLMGMWASFTSWLGIATTDSITATMQLSADEMQVAYLGTLGITIPAAIEAATIMLMSTMMECTSTIIMAMAGATGKSVMSLLGLATGGHVSGPGTGTSDSIPAMLSNGEFVVNAKATKRFAPLLNAINSDSIARFADGGFVGAIDMPATAIPVSTKGQSTAVYNINVTGDVSRQTRLEIQRMMPQIASGVNTHNYESGSRRR